jgi:hypothetical protein
MFHEVRVRLVKSRAVLGDPRLGRRERLAIRWPAAPVA